MKNILIIIYIALAGQFTLAKDLVIEIKSTANGFEPASIDVTPNEPVVLKVTRTTDETCATDIQIKSKKINQKLPLNEAVTINLGKLKKGEVKFNCGMNMFTGSIKVK